MIGSLLAPPLSADIIHLKSGGRVEGEVVESGVESVTIQTAVGTVRLSAADIERIEERESPREEYERRAAELSSEKGSAAEHAELAAWCAENDLDELAESHYRRALEIDPEHASARAALGFVRVGNLWVQAAPESQPAATQPARRDKRPKSSAEVEGEAYVNAEQGRWRLRLRAIRKTLLESRLNRSVENGRQQIRAIQDPLAIVPLTEVLLESKAVVAREALVEALARFPQDEATLNLAVVALLDEVGTVRYQAVTELARRDDPRVIPQFREALHSDSSVIVRNAAEALGALKARAAIPDLIDALAAQERKRVEVPTRNYFGQLPDVFNGGTTIQVRGSSFTYGPRIGLPSQAGIFTTIGNQVQAQNVIVFRTEVLEALKAITGVNFGFDGAAWRGWYEREQQP